MMAYNKLCQVTFHGYSNIFLELQDVFLNYSGYGEDNITNFIMLDILANLTSTDEVAGLVQAANEEMEEMTDYVQSFNDGWFEEEHVNATVQSWADTRVKFPNLGFHLFESDSKVMRRIRTAEIWEWP